MLSEKERNEFLENLKENGIAAIYNMEDKHKDDDIIMKGLIKLNGACIALASDRIKNDEKMIELALASKSTYLGSFNGKPHTFTIEHINKDYLKNHLEHVYAFLNNHLEYARLLGEEILSIKEVHEYILNNLEKATILWSSLSDTEKYSKAVIMKVINEMPNIIGELPLELQKDVDIVKEASRDRNPEFNGVIAMYNRMHKEARQDPEVCRVLMKADPRVFPYLEYKDENIIIQGLEFDGKNLVHVPEINDIYKYVKLAVNQDGLALEYASRRLKDNDDIVISAVKNNGWAINLASSRLQETQDIIDMAISKSPELRKYGWGKVKNNSK